jgi:hypothetical protein
MSPSEMWRCVSIGLVAEHPLKRRSVTRVSGILMVGMRGALL